MQVPISHKVHYKIAMIIYIIAIPTLMFCIPLALVLKHYICLLSLLSIVIYLYFRFFIKATCTKKKCGGMVLRSTDWTPRKFFHVTHNTIYTCKKCGAVTKYSEGSIVY